MRVSHVIAFAAAGVMFAFAAPAPARAQNDPVIVVPGRPGIPVMLNGVDVSGAVIEGEGGLNRPDQTARTVIMPYWAPGNAPPTGGYFPSTGQQPRVGRLEVVPPANRPMPSPAAPFYREWHSDSPLTPATSPTPEAPPTVIVTPQAAGAPPRRPPPRQFAPPPPPLAPPGPPPKP